MRTFAILLLTVTFVGLSGPAQAGEEERERGEKRAAGIVRGLANGLEALRALDKDDLAAKLEALLKHVQERRALVRAKRGTREEAQDAGRAEYLRGLRERLDVMRMAEVAFREAEAEAPLEAMHRAMHTAELLLEGRKDEEAQAAFKKTPTLGALAELCAHAAKLWKKFGDKKKAKACWSLASHYKERWAAQQRELAAAKEQKAKSEQEKKARKADRRRRSERKETLQQLREELRRLLQHLDHLAHRLRELDR